MSKADRTMEPLPHLIIVADEFAELKADNPEFIDDLVSAARVGRSLGTSNTCDPKTFWCCK